MSFSKKTISLFLLLLATLSVSAQDTNYVRYQIRQLSSEQFHGRGYSYRGDSIAAEYIRAELKRLQVQPLGDNYYQPYTFSVSSMERSVR